jgi:hypothetical protein
MLTEDKVASRRKPGRERDTEGKYPVSASLARGRRSSEPVRLGLDTMASLLTRMRLELLSLVARNPGTTAAALAAKTGRTKTPIALDLARLQAAGLLVARKQGRGLPYTYTAVVDSADTLHAEISL